MNKEAVSNRDGFFIGSGLNPKAGTIFMSFYNILLNIILIIGYFNNPN